METTPNLKWHRAVAGATEFTFVGDYKIVRFPAGGNVTCAYRWTTVFYVVQKCEHGMPVGPSASFDYLDDALSWIGA